jgi:putative membrane-bound dehydrogenase-like protein
MLRTVLPRSVFIVTGRVLIGLLAANGVPSAPAAEPTVTASQLPRIPPTPPERALSTFRIKPGFSLELAAAEPSVVDPIALSFDEDGRLYVVEMRDYSERRPERLGRIRRLIDSDGDGRFEQSVIFAEDLPWPTALFCYGGGIFVGITPDIWWMRDLDGDGRADERERVFTGFAADAAPFATNKLNVQALLNSFNWSLDNRIHGATSFSGGKVQRVDSPFVRQWRQDGGPPSLRQSRRASTKDAADQTANPVDPQEATVLELRGRDFSFDPRALEMRAESGGGQHGMSFDDEGRKFVCSNSSHLQMLRYEERYASGPAASVLPRALVDIAVDGGAAPVYRLSPDEPWRVLRTQWRVAGLVPGPIEGGGRPSGYFTGATGVTIYRGDAYGADFVGNAFVGDAGGNLVHRKLIQTTEAGVRGIRPPDEQQTEFLASTDNWFRPVQFGNGPDGCLYLCDMYREVIEHPWSLPLSIKNHLDLNSGNDRGRIYRIVPAGFKRPPAPRWSRARTSQLVRALNSDNGWQRDTVSRLLYESRDPDAERHLRRLASSTSASSGAALARVHALYGLAGQSRLDSADLLRALGDASPVVRRHAVRLSEPWLPHSTNASHFVAGFLPLAGDPDERVREQLGFTIRFLPRELRFQVALALFRGRPLGESGYALMSSISAEAGAIFRAMATADPALTAANATGLVRTIGGGIRQRPAEVSAVIDVIAQAMERGKASRGAPSTIFRLAATLADGLSLAGRSLADADPAGRLQPVYDSARDVIRLNQGATAEAFAILGSASYETGAAVLLEALEQQPNHAVIAAAALGRQTDPRLADEVLARWPRFSSAARNEILGILVKRTERIRALIAAMEQGKIKGADLPPALQRQLRDHRDPAIREAATRVLGPAAASAREPLIAKYQGALQLQGTAEAGRITFQGRCASCHRLGREGHALGPDLVTVRNGGKEKILANILDPNREINGNFASYTVETDDGESLVGIIRAENAASVSLRMAGGVESVLPRERIVRLQGQGRSLMPEGLEEGLTLQDMADLLAFILVEP